MNDEDLLSTELLLSYAYEALRRQTDIFDRIDSKAVSIAGFSGIIFALATLFTKNLFLQTEEKTVSEIFFAAGVQVSFVLLIVSLACSFGYCISALAVRQVKETWSIKKTIEHYKSSGPLESRRRPLLKTLVVIISKTEENLRSNNSVKAVKIRKATNYLRISLITGVGGFVLYVIKVIYIG
ncbi:MAG: hypothetical protein ACYSWZ_11965 [Planctomycetota bacterium]|jgi:hypothetical protein